MTRTGSLRITTRHELVDEFLTSFSRWVDEDSIFIVTREVRPVGLNLAFTVELKDGRPILRGQAEIVHTFTNGDGPNGKNGIQLKIIDMDVRSKEVFRQLLERRRKPIVRATSIEESLPPLPALVEDSFDTVLDELPASMVPGVGPVALPLSVPPPLPEEPPAPEPAPQPRHESARVRVSAPMPVVPEPAPPRKASIFMVVLFVIGGILFIVNMILLLTR